MEAPKTLQPGQKHKKMPSGKCTRRLRNTEFCNTYIYIYVRSKNMYRNRCANKSRLYTKQEHTASARWAHGLTHERSSHGCTGNRMLSKHERNYGLGMDALVTVCPPNTNGIMVWACVQWSPYGLETRMELWFGHGCTGHRMLSTHERNYGLGMYAVVTVWSRNTNGIMVWACMHWSPYALDTRTELWFGHGCTGHRMLSTHERNYGLGMYAVVTVWSRNTNGIMVWAWMHWSPYALDTRTEIMVWACMQWSPYGLETRTELWFGRVCSAHGHRMLSKHERNYGLGMDALVTVCPPNTNGIMVWACVQWSPYGLETRMELWFGHGCTGHRMLSTHERNYGLGMYAVVTVWSRNTNGIMVWACMHWSPYALETRTELWFGRDTNLLALAVFREGRKLQNCSIHCQGQRKQPS